MANAADSEKKAGRCSAVLVRAQMNEKMNHYQSIRNNNEHETQRTHNPHQKLCFSDESAGAS
jgi:hypothetical protein